MEPFIQMTNVSKIYGVGDAQVGALKRLSLSIHRGEFAAIIGHSGSGKSTLMNLLGCLDFPTQGEYLLDGKPVAGLSDRQLSHIRNEQIGFVFQSFYLIPSLSALENVELPLLYRGVPRSRRRALAAQALEQVGLAQRILHRPGQLSGTGGGNAAGAGAYGQAQASARPAFRRPAAAGCNRPGNCRLAAHSAGR